jgi:hypothetical protein
MCHCLRYAASKVEIWAETDTELVAEVTAVDRGASEMESGRNMGLKCFSKIHIDSPGLQAQFCGL